MSTTMCFPSWVSRMPGSCRAVTKRTAVKCELPSDWLTHEDRHANLWHHAAAQPSIGDILLDGHHSWPAIDFVIRQFWAWSEPSGSIQGQVKVVQCQMCSKANMWHKCHPFHTSWHMGAMERFVAVPLNRELRWTSAKGTSFISLTVSTICTTAARRPDQASERPSARNKVQWIGGRILASDGTLVPLQSTMRPIWQYSITPPKFLP